MVLKKSTKIDSGIERIYDLKTSYKGRNQIRIFGVAHGFFLPMARPYVKYIRKKLGKYNSDIYTEGEPWFFLPVEHWGRGIEIENSFVHEQALRMLLKPRGLVAFPFAFVDEVNPFKRYKRKDVTRIPISKQEYRQYLKSLEKGILNIAGFKPADIRYLTTVRSLFLAGDLLKQARQQKNDISFVTGTGHASLIHRFIENPRLALKYIAKISPVLAKKDAKFKKILDATKSEFQEINQ